MKYYIFMFIIFFIIIYSLYYNFIIRPQLKGKKTNIPSDVQILKSYYKIDIDKLGLFRVLRILNFTNSLMLSLLLIGVMPLKYILVKFIVLAILILPSIWFTYFILAKYLRHLERKSDL